MPAPPLWGGGGGGGAHVSYAHGVLVLI
jgi:hypothetical protein